MKVNELFEGPKLGRRVEFASYAEWKKALPKKSDLIKTGQTERAQVLGKDFEGVAGTFDHDKKTGWIYQYYLDAVNLHEGDGTRYLVDTTQANTYIRMWQRIV
jgi:hypothetical protein